MLEDEEFEISMDNDSTTFDEELIVYTILSFIGGVGIGLLIASYMMGG
jgi:hypothetical protein